MPISPKALTASRSSIMAFVLACCCLGISACNKGKEKAIEAEIDQIASGENPTQNLAPSPLPGGSSTTDTTDCAPSANEQALLDAHNVARQQARVCGTESFAAAPPLVWSCKLGQIAREHSQDMAQNSFMSHTGSDGLSPFHRMDNVGYRYAYASENVASGYRSVEAVMQGWLESPGHCQNIMNGTVTELGSSYATNDNAAYYIYWTTAFGKPR